MEQQFCTSVTDFFYQYNFQLKAIQSTQIKSKNEITSHWKVSGSVKNHQKLITCLLNDVKIIQLEF